MRISYFYYIFLLFSFCCSKKNEDIWDRCNYPTAIIRPDSRHSNFLFFNLSGESKNINEIKIKIKISIYHQSIERYYLIGHET